MPDITALKSIEQREVEQSFAAQAWRFPLYTVTNCGWLRPEILLNQTVKKFWTLLVEGIAPNMSEEEAAIVATTAAVVADTESDLMKWVELTNQSSMPESYANEIVRRAYIHNVSSSLPELANAIDASDDQKIKEVVARLNSDISVGGLEMKTALDVAERFVDVIRRGDRVVKTYMPIDKAIGGLEKQTEIVIAARPSMGKTALVWQICRCVGSSGKKVAFFSLEMSTTALWARAACPAVDLVWRDVLAGDISDDDENRLVKKALEMGEQYKDTIFIDDRPKTTDDIWRSVASLGPDLVVVDHLRLLKDEGDNEVRRLGYCSERLRDIAKASDIPVLVVAQLSRATEGRTDKRPMLSDLRESGHIEENADVILMMYRDDYYNPTMETLTSGESPTEVLVRKFRDGPATTKVELIFDKKNEWFENAN